MFFILEDEVVGMGMMRQPAAAAIIQHQTKKIYLLHQQQISNIYTKHEKEITNNKKK